MKYFYCTLTILVMSITIVKSQPFTIEWQKSYGGTWGDDGNAIELTNDGGYIIAGYSGSIDGDVNCSINSTHDWVIKLDGYGNIQWQNCYGINQLYTIKKTNDGGYILGGATYDTATIGFHGGAYDGIIIKIDSVGNVKWQKAYGGDSLDAIRMIVLGNDDGYIVSGESISNNGDLTNNNGDFDGWVMKLDSVGNIKWSKSYGGPGAEQIRGIIPTKDFGYILAGSSGSVGGDITSNHGLLDFWILKLDINGNLVWQKNYGGSDYDVGWSITEKSTNGYLVTGKTYSNNFDVHGFKGSEDIWILNLDINGDTIWTKTFGGSGGDEANVIKKLNGNHFVVGGRTESSDDDVSFNHGFGDCWLFGIDISGSILWEKSYGGTQNDWLLDVEKTNGGFVFCGASHSNDGDLTENKGYEDYWIVKLDTNAVTETNEIGNSSNFSIFPNPTEKNFIITFPSDTKQIQILNSLGQVALQAISKDQTNYNFDLENSGIYFIQIITDKQTITKRLIVF